MVAEPDIAYLQALLHKYGVRADVQDLMHRWQEPHRFYHSSAHLDDLLQQITTSFRKGSITLTQKELLEITALFHDIIYDPARRDNEELSASYFLALCDDENAPAIKEIHDAILATRDHAATTPLAALFNKYDMSIVERGLPELLDWEYGIYQEYKIFGNMAYKLGRLQFIEKLRKQYPHNKDNLEQLMAWVMMNY